MVDTTKLRNRYLSQLLAGAAGVLYTNQLRYGMCEQERIWTPMARSLSVDQLLALNSIVSGDRPCWMPDGETILFVSGLGGEPDLWTIRADGTALKRLTSGMGGVGHLASFMPCVSPSGDRVAYVSAKSGADEVWLWSADGSEPVQITCLGARIESLAWAPDGGSLLVSSSSRGTFDIYRVDLNGGETSRLTNDNRYEVYAVATPDGQRVLYVRLNDDWTDHEVVSIANNGSDARMVLLDTDFFDYHYGQRFGYPLVSPDGELFLFRSERSGWINIWAARVDGTGEPWQISKSEAEQSDAAWSPDGRTVAFIENHNGTFGLRTVDIGGGEVRELVQPEMGICETPAWSPDGKRIVYRFATPLSPADLWVVDVECAETSQLTHSGLGDDVHQHLVAPEKVSYRSFDGLEIHAYLYRPARLAGGERSPGILWVHGGPTSQYVDSLHPQVQFFVSQGYTVLMPNFRGSTGYGREFEDLNNQDWGHGDLRDVIAGADYLKTLDGIDPDHIGITGVSYGGIMSIAATVWAPGVFQAAIPCSGYADFVHIAGEEELRHVKLMDYEFGKLPDALDIYRRCSPIYWAHQAGTPCFLVHGEGLYPGSTASKDFALALEANYKPFWYKAYRGETYYVASTANVREMLFDMLAFFNFYLRGVAHDLPEASRPITRLSGAIDYRSWLSTAPGGPNGGEGPKYGPGQMSTAGTE
jgi:dipeptidyl aminopeptidase/acylaminoacyl peptidase